MTYDVGNRSAAYLMLIIPLVASGLLWLSVFLRRSSYHRRFHGWRLAWEMWGSSILISAVLFGGFYWYLFWYPFYTVTLSPDGAWSLGYDLPARTVTIAAAQIDAVRLEDERLPLVRPGRRQYLLVVLRDGRSFTGAPMIRPNATYLLEQLRARLPPSTAGTYSPEPHPAPPHYLQQSTAHLAMLGMSRAYAIIALRIAWAITAVD